MIALIRILCLICARRAPLNIRVLIANDLENLALHLSAARCQSHTPYLNYDEPSTTGRIWG